MSHPPTQVHGLGRQEIGAFCSPCTLRREPDRALATRATHRPGHDSLEGAPQGRVQARPGTLSGLQLGREGGSKSGQPGLVRPGPGAYSRSAPPGPASSEGARVHTGTRGRGAPSPPARADPPDPRARGRACAPTAPLWVARTQPRCGPAGRPGEAARRGGRRWCRPRPTPPARPRPPPPARPAQLKPGEGALPGQVRGVSGQGQQEPTAAQRPRGPVGPAATPCRGPPAALPDSRSRPRPARSPRRLPVRAAPGGGAAPPAARPHSSAGRPPAAAPGTPAPPDPARAPDPGVPPGGATRDPGPLPPETAEAPTSRAPRPQAPICSPKA